MEINLKATPACRPTRHAGRSENRRLPQDTADHRRTGWEAVIKATNLSLYW